MISNEQIICSYIKEIKHHLPIYKSEEKKFINDLQNAIMDFSNETKEFTYKDGVISYEASAMGTTKTVKLEKQDK